ncbi:MAG: hypothetical protein C5B59_00955 [Bacteroidetes bacterium]|nr:MAG: hypothetical protein C5B59_00955 [Bacteroidota bacterium]
MKKKKTFKKEYQAINEGLSNVWAAPGISTYPRNSSCSPLDAIHHTITTINHSKINIQMDDKLSRFMEIFEEGPLPETFIRYVDAARQYQFVRANYNLIARAPLYMKDKSEFMRMMEDRFGQVDKITSDFHRLKKDTYTQMKLALEEDPIAKSILLEVFDQTEMKYDQRIALIIAELVLTTSKKPSTTYKN